MIAYECESLVVKTACLIVAIGTESPIVAHCCILGIVEVVAANICISFNISAALRTGISRICRLRGNGQAGFCHVLSVQDPTNLTPGVDAVSQ